MDSLLEKNAEGAITRAEKATLERLVCEAERLMVHNAQRLAEHAGRQSADVPHEAVPVTVWVKADPAER